MGHFREPPPPPALAMTPMQVIRSLRWVGDLHDDELVRAIQSVADIDLAAEWPELSADEVATMREQCRDMTRSRMQAWKGRTPRDPTWLEVRAMISGLHRLLV